MKKLIVASLIMAIFICFNSVNAIAPPEQTRHYDVKMSNRNDSPGNDINQAVALRLPNGTLIDAWWVANLEDVTENGIGRAHETQGIYTFSGSFDYANTNISISSTLVLPDRNITKQFVVPAIGVWSGTANSSSGTLDFAFAEEVSREGWSLNIGDTADPVETGIPWALKRDQAVPLSATINLSDGTFNLGTYGIVLDMPYVRAADGGPLKAYMQSEYGQFVLTPSVGGTVVFIDKLTLLAPYLGLTFAVGAATVSTAIYFRRIKHRKVKST
jgi:hypothetical protein